MVVLCLFLISNYDIQKYGYNVLSCFIQSLILNSFYDWLKINTKVSYNRPHVV